MTGCEKNTDKSGMDEYFDKNPIETEERSDLNLRTLQVNPAAAQINRVGQQVVFEGIGGKGPYRWSVADPEVGEVRVLGWSQGIYTSKRVGNNHVICLDRHGHSAIANILPELATLTISPDEYTIEFQGAPSAVSVSFYARGGSPPYRWTVASPGLGSISYSASSSHNASYRSTPNIGVNIVTVIDSDGRTASASVKQEME